MERLAKSAIRSGVLIRWGSPAPHALSPAPSLAAKNRPHVRYLRTLLEVDSNRSRAPRAGCTRRGAGTKDSAPAPIPAPSAGRTAARPPRWCPKVGQEYGVGFRPDGREGTSAPYGVQPHSCENLAPGRVLLLLGLGAGFSRSAVASRLLGVSRRKLNYMIRRMGITHPSWRRNRTSEVPGDGPGEPQGGPPLIPGRRA